MDHQDLVDSLVKEYAKIEKQAASILQDKQEIIDLDLRRNKTREALRQMKKEKEKPAHKKDAKTWLCLGNTFLKVDSPVCERMLKKDQDTLDTEVEKLREGLKPKVAQLHKMEGAAEVKGFELKGMNIEEILNMRGSAGDR